MGEMVMMNVHGWATPPSIEQVAEQLQVPVAAIDTKFGVILVDPKQRIYTVRVNAAAIEKVNTPDKDVSGPYSDPKIAPFGPPKTGKE